MVFIYGNCSFSDLYTSVLVSYDKFWQYPGMYDPILHGLSVLKWVALPSVVFSVGVAAASAALARGCAGRVLRGRARALGLAAGAALVGGGVLFLVAEAEVQRGAEGFILRRTKTAQEEKGERSLSPDVLTGTRRFRTGLALACASVPLLIGACWRRRGTAPTSNADRPCAITGIASIAALGFCYSFPIWPFRSGWFRGFLDPDYLNAGGRFDFMEMGAGFSNVLMNWWLSGLCLVLLGMCVWAAALCGIWETKPGATEQGAPEERSGTEGDRAEV